MLILLQRTLGVERVVLNVVVRLPVQLVGAGLDSQVDLAGALPVFGGVKARLHLEFLNGKFGGDARRGREEVVGVGHPIHHKTDRLRPLAVQADFSEGVIQAVVCPVELRTTRDVACACDQAQKVVEIAPARRQFLNCLLIQNVAGRCVVRLHHLSVGRDRNRFPGSADLQGEVLAQSLIYFENQIAADLRLETVTLNLHLICARNYVHEQVIAGAFGSEVVGHVGVDVRGDYVCASDGGA